MAAGKIYLVPTSLHEKGLPAIPSYVADAVKNCQVFFTENERTARRYLKQIWKEMVIDNYEWHTISDNAELADTFKKRIREGKTIAIISEAGCPGVADPGQLLVAIAQEMNAEVIPLSGPNSILLALMASGMNGQQFQFVGYLPIDSQERAKAIKELEAASQKKNCTQIFIETPYRNNQLIEALLKNCKPGTRICIAVDLTAPEEWVRTKTSAEWQKEKPDIHKHPAVFLIYAGN
jgi:16S rRNA (cytidine1402-2'-O)-methyltransferase